MIAVWSCSCVDVWMSVLWSAGVLAYCLYGQDVRLDRVRNARAYDAYRSQYLVTWGRKEEKSRRKILKAANVELIENLQWRRQNRS